MHFKIIFDPGASNLIDHFNIFLFKHTTYRDFDRKRR